MNLLRITLLILLASSLIHCFKKRFYIANVVIALNLGYLLSLTSIDAYKAIIIVCIILFDLFLFFIKEKNLSISNSNIIMIICFGSFSFLILLSMLYSQAYGLPYYYWKTMMYFALVLLPVIVVIIIGRCKISELNYLHKFFFRTSIIVAIFMVYNIYFGESLVEFNYFSRVSVNETNSILTARYLSTASLMLLDSKIFKKPLYSYIYSIFLLFISIFTGSKIVIFFAIPLALIYIAIKSKDMKYKIIIIIIGLGIIIGGFSYIEHSDNIAIVRRFSTKSGTISQRLDMQRLVMQNYLNNKRYLFGNGVGSVTVALENIYEREYPHNIIIEVLYEFGLVGLLIIFIPMFMTIVGTLINNKSQYYKHWLFWCFILHFLYAQTSGDLIWNNFMFLYYIVFYIFTNNKANGLSNHQKQPGG